jgi:hypothetical protein
MTNYIFTFLITILLGIGVYQYFEIEKYKTAEYVSNIEVKNLRAEADSTRKISDNLYARLSKQLFENDSIVKSYEAKLQRKDASILSLSQINAELKMDKEELKNLVAKFDSSKNAYIFKSDSGNFYIVGKVNIIKEGKEARVHIDTLKVPIKLEVAFIKYVSDDEIEVQVNTNNSNIVINNISSFVKVPSKPIVQEQKGWKFFLGGLIGNQWGPVVGVRYKSLYFIGTLQNTGYSIGAAYEF